MGKAVRSACGPELLTGSIQSRALWTPHYGPAPILSCAQTVFLVLTTFSEKWA